MDELRLVFLHLYLKFISNINIYQYEKKKIIISYAQKTP